MLKEAKQGQEGPVDYTGNLCIHISYIDDISYIPTKIIYLISEFVRILSTSTHDIVNLTHKYLRK